VLTQTKIYDKIVSKKNKAGSKKMEITEVDYSKIAHLLPKQRGHVVTMILFLNALLYAIENGCKWRKLPKEYGKWNTIYQRARRWSKNGTLAVVFIELQRLEIIKIKIERMSLDSRSIKVHPDAHGAAKKTESKPSGRASAGGTQNFMWVPLMSDSP
jgi:transposase